MFLFLNVLASFVALLIIRKHISMNQGDSRHLDNNKIDLSPTEVNVLYKNINYLNRAIMVSLLDLYSRGNINIEKYTRQSRNKNIADFVVEYKFTLLSKENLNSHEAMLIDNIFQEKTITTTDELTERAKGGREYYSQQGLWAQEIERSLAEKGLYDTGDKEDYKRTLIQGLVIFLIGLFTVIKGEIYGLLSLILSFGIFLAAINIRMNTSVMGASLLNYFTNMETDIRSGKLIGVNSEKELLEILTLATSMKYFLPIYKNSPKYPSIDLVAGDLNPGDGSYLDDAILRAFMKFTEPTRSDSIDTNRIDMKLFK